MKQFLVIGASGGIGKALSAKLCESGNVLGTYYENDKNLNSNIEWHHLDVLNPNFDWLPEKIDGLAYCPGSINLKPFKRISRSDFVSDFDLQVGGAVEVIQQCLPGLRKSGNASVVLFSTVAVNQGFNFHTQVAASKGALEGLGKSLAAELAPTVRVNLVAPSLTDTKLSEKLLNTESKREQNAQRHPLQRIGKPEDIADIAAFLLGEQSSWITGQVIHVDGGMSNLKV